MNKKKVLYVEDDATLAFITIDNLEQNYEVVHCENGKRALEQFSKNSFDIIVSDIMMPEMDGFEMASKVRQKDQEIPIIFLSAKTLKEDRIHGLKLGADDYLVKPYSIEELMLKMEVFLHRSQKQSKPINKSYQVGEYTFEPENFLLKNPSLKITLTEREAQLLKLFLEHPNMVLKREKILIELWGNDDYFLGRSLDVFISRLRKIIKEQPGLSIENIPRVGFKWVSE